MRLERMVPAMLLALALCLFSLPVEARDANQLLRSMTLEEKVAQLLFPSLTTGAGRPVAEMTGETAAALRRYPVGGVILSRGNLVTAGQTRKLIADLQAASRLPLFIGIDQEGGRVTRLPYGTVTPGNMALAATGDPESAYQAARLIGGELAGLGFNLNFAPVLDINSNPANPVIGVRSFGEDPELVAAMGQSFIRGLQAAGIAAAVKHFPGHGDTSVDSHLGLPSLPYDRQSLERRELKPFIDVLAAAPPDMIMTAHIALPLLDPETVRSVKDAAAVHLPATLSHPVLTGLLRNQLGYDGIIITDALNMRAVTEHFGAGEAAVRAIQAGADLLLMPDLEASYTALLAAVRRGDITEQRLDQSVRRILTLKIRRGIIDRIPGSQTHTAEQKAELEARLAAQAVTLLKNDGPVLPFKLWPKRKLLLLAPQPDQAAAMRQAAERLFAAAGLSGQAVTAMAYQETVSPAHLAALAAADDIILAADSGAAAGRSVSSVPSTAVILAGLAAETGKPFAVIALRNPYDISYLQAAPALLAVYAPVEPNIAAGIRAIYGQKPVQGKLPVTVVDQSGGTIYPRGYGLHLPAREE